MANRPLFDLNEVSKKCQKNRKFPQKFLSGWCETIALAAIGLRLNLVEFIKAGKKLLIYGLSTLVFQVVLALILISLLIK